MKKLLKISLLVLLIVLLGIVVVYQFRSAEPMYQGKTVTQWIISHPPKITLPSAPIPTPSPSGAVFSQNAMAIVTINLGTNQGKPVLLTSSNTFSQYSAELSRMEESATALKEIGLPAVPYLVSALRHGGGVADRVHQKAWDSLPVASRTNYLTPPVPATELRRSAALILANPRIARFSQDAVPALAEALSDTDIEVRLYAVFALCTAGTNAASATSELLRAATNDSSSMVRVYAVRALGAQGQQARQAVPVLKEILRTNTNNLAMQAEAYRSIEDITGPGQR
jgi:hypothetical protein